MWTPPSPRTTGELITASIWNTDLKDNLLLLKTSVLNDGRIGGELAVYWEESITIPITGGVLGIDLSASNNFRVNLTQNITSITISNWNALKGKAVRLRLSQDGTGGRTVAFPAGWLWANNTPPTMTATANRTDIVQLWSDDGGGAIWPSLLTKNA